jgi:hypothetical protein
MDVLVLWCRSKSSAVRGVWKSAVPLAIRRLAAIAQKATSTTSGFLLSEPDGCRLSYNTAV